MSLPFLESLSSSSSSLSALFLVVISFALSFAAKINKKYMLINKKMYASTESTQVNYKKTLINYNSY